MNVNWTRWRRFHARANGLAGSALAAVLLACVAQTAHAVPSFARQTGLECTSCHLSWPELTPTGRQFKLNGYTLGERSLFPVAGMLQLSRSSTSSLDAQPSDNFPRDGAVLMQQASLFVSGKLADHVGLFSQWTYDGVGHRTSIDNVDLRFANHGELMGHKFVYGATLNNNPQVQDVYNTGQAWGFPFSSSPVALTPNAGLAIEGLGQQVAGLGAYTLWDNTLYAELTDYRTADRMFSVLRAGTDRAEDAALKGDNLYWRLGLQHEWGEGQHSAMLGAYGFTLDRYPDNTNLSGPTDRFRDTGIDAQYQYITDQHRVSLQANYVREQQDWLATPQGNSSDTLRSFKAKATYYYQKQYGVNVGYFSTKGDADSVLYNTGDPTTGSASGSPNSTGTVWELNYLPRRDIRLALQYTAYSRFNGARNNYDGFGRNAKDNNTLYLLAWLMF